MRFRTALFAAAFLAAPLAARAQGNAQIRPFAGPTRTYALTGCGGKFDFEDPPRRFIPDAVCVSGTATLGLVLADLPNFGSPYSQLLLDLQVTRSPDYPNVALYEGGSAGLNVPPPCGALFCQRNDPLFVAGGTPTPPGPLTLVGLFIGSHADAVLASVSLFYFTRYTTPASLGTIVITPTISAVPEPSTFALAAVGGLALGAGVVRRRRQSAE